MKYPLRTAGLLSCVFLSSLHATTLGHVSVNSPILGTRVLTYNAINGYALVEGDIVIGKISELQNQGAVVTPKISGTRWPNGVVPYEIDKDLPFRNKLAILQAIDHWQQNTPIEFLELNAENRAKYPDFISFIPASGTTCSSYVGRQGGKQIINLAPRCTTMNTVHELGHALGMWHEQSRADRNQYIRIAWENIYEDYKSNFEQQLTDGKDFGEYDYDSLMHYGPFAFSKNGQQTIFPLIPDVKIGQRNHLSDKDIAAIRAMYPEN